MAVRQRIIRRAPPPSGATLPRTSAPAVATQAPQQPATANQRPAWCPSSAAVDARIVYLRGYFATHTDSDDRAAAIDSFNRFAHVDCLSTAQALRLQSITQTAQAQAQKEATSFSIIDQVFGKLAPLLKVGAGGTMLLVSGLALVYVAGRNTSAGQGARGGARELKRAAKVVANPASAVYSRSGAGIRRQELRKERAKVRGYVREDRRGEARSEAQERVRRAGAKGQRIRTVSRSRARREAGQGAEILRRQAAEKATGSRNARGEKIIPGIRVNRRAAVRHG